MEVKCRTLRSLVARLGNVSEQTRAEALAELRLISKHDADSRPIIADAGAIPYISEALYSSIAAVEENAAATLLNLSITCRSALMSTRGLLDAISHVLSHSTTAAAVQASAATLHSLLVGEESYRAIIGSKRDIIYSLVRIITDGNSPPRSVKDALKALFGISLYPLNRTSLVDLGAVSALVSLIVRDSRTGVVEDASAVLAQIAGCEECEEAMRKSGGVRILADLLDEATGATTRTRENAVASLLNLVRSGGDRGRRDVREAGLKVIEDIADVAEDGSEKGKMKALQLLKFLVEGDNLNGFQPVRDTRFDCLLNQSA